MISFIAPLLGTVAHALGTNANVGEGFVNGVTTLLSGIAGWFTTALSSVGAMLYDSTANSLTTIGWIVSIVIATGLVGFAIKFVMGLLRRIK